MTISSNIEEFHITKSDSEPSQVNMEFRTKQLIRLLLYDF